jgi:hypothetical protein
MIKTLNIFFAQLLHNFYTTLITFFFLRVIIEYIEFTCRKSNPIVDCKKKKIVGVVQKLCKKYYYFKNAILVE